MAKKWRRNNGMAANRRKYQLCVMKMCGGWPVMTVGNAMTESNEM